jgi:hypothetical protein
MKNPLNLKTLLGLILGGLSGLPCTSVLACDPSTSCCLGSNIVFTQLPSSFAIGGTVIVGQNGNIGFGNPNPLARLDLMAPADTDSTSILFQVESTDGTLMSLKNNGDLQFGLTSNAQTIQINSPKTQIASNLTVQNLNLNGPLDFQYNGSSSLVVNQGLSLNTASDSATQLLVNYASTPASNAAAFQATDSDGVNLLTVTSQGKVGIGPNLNPSGYRLIHGAWPSEALEVGGSIKVSSSNLHFEPTSNSAPSCSSRLDGAVALMSSNLCVCKGSKSQWVRTANGTTGC